MIVGYILNRGLIIKDVTTAKFLQLSFPILFAAEPVPYFLKKVFEESPDQ
jgi:hypothetical protein